MSAMQIVEHYPAIQKLLERKRNPEPVRDMLTWTTGQTIADIVNQIRQYQMHVCGMHHEHPDAKHSQYNCPIRAQNLCCGHSNDPNMFPFRQDIKRLEQFAPSELSDNEQEYLHVLQGHSVGKQLQRGLLLADGIRGRLPVQQNVLRRPLIRYHPLYRQIEKIGLQLGDLDVLTNAVLATKFTPSEALSDASDEYYTRGYTRTEYWPVRHAVDALRQEKRRELTQLEVVQIIRQRQQMHGEKMRSARDEVVAELEASENFVG